MTDRTMIVRGVAVLIAISLATVAVIAWGPLAGAIVIAAFIAVGGGRLVIGGRR